MANITAAFHSNWTRPFLARYPGTPYRVEPFELLTTILSALQWRKLGGTIRMITDQCGATYYRTLGLDNLWDDGIHPLLDSLIPESISPFAFWAAGKLYALREMIAPCAMIDTDFIVWRDISSLCTDADVAVIHFEDIYPDIYPGRERFERASGLDLSTLDWTVRPSNTALTVFQHDNFRVEYTSQAISYMEQALSADDPLIYMVFAEQRMLSMCAAKQDVTLLSLSELPALFHSDQNYFTHVWGFKQQLRESQAVYEAFCRKCASRICKDFPDFVPTACAIEDLIPYFKPVQSSPL